MTDHLRLMLPFDAGTLDLPPSGQIAIIRAFGSYPDLPKDRIICVQGLFPAHQALSNAGYTTAPSLPDTAAMAVLHITRAKEETRALMAQAYDMLDPDGVLLVDGSKTDGIESLLKESKKRSTVAGQVSKAHGKVFWLYKQAGENPFADWMGATTPAQNADGFFTSAGVFSADAIDPGSAELAPAFAGKLKGRVADLGAGWGWLSAHALQTCPDITAIDLIEAEQAALDCARLNIADDRASFHWADATRPTSKNIYDAVITNPPFHTGRKADPSLGRAFITAAATLLKPTGQMYLVANRQLAYEATLDASFARWEVMSQSSRYKVIHARKPKL
ncbi:methyltransferase [Amylibacter sp. IMCC11727]|uniref:class I SAM-dependent methyltransferase n=1 Tax=Amylibacter sp. IMCC11727 TaxID=3039851 RepID=UPI00244DDD8E|nr:methyltransferase [Amylibacter sp. IMCC11727]WGI22761.1 methyltransferase [Amylibacter sp. IMCC11727]